MNHTGTEIIETERLILRKFRSDDTENVYKNWASDEEVTKYLTWPAHQKITTTQRVIASWIEEYKEQKNYQWCIELKSIGEAIGTIAAVNIIDDIECIEIGYCIGKSYWNRGIVTEAFRAIIKFFFNKVNANKITARYDVNNQASGRVMKKSGLHFEGVNRQGDRNNTGICDDYVYSILREEFLAAENFQIRSISNENRQQINEFIISKWKSAEMVVREQVFDMTLLDGLAAYNDEKILGLATYLIEEKTCEIISLDSVVENMGIGTALINEVIKKARDKNCTKIKLITTNDNIDAIRFYEQRGFDMVCIYRNAVDKARKLKKSIPVIGDFNIPIKHEIEFEMLI